MPTKKVIVPKPVVVPKPAIAPLTAVNPITPIIAFGILARAIRSIAQDLRLTSVVDEMDKLVETPVEMS